MKITVKCVAILGYDGIAPLPGHGEKRRDKYSREAAAVPGTTPYFMIYVDTPDAQYYFLCRAWGKGFRHYDIVALDTSQSQIVSCYTTPARYWTAHAVRHRKCVTGAVIRRAIAEYGE